MQSGILCANVDATKVNAVRRNADDAYACMRGRLLPMSHVSSSCCSVLSRPKGTVYGGKVERRFEWRAHMAVAKGSAYSGYRSQPKVFRLAVLHGCWVNMLGKGSCGIDEGVMALLYAGAL